MRNHLLKSIHLDPDLLSYRSVLLFMSYFQRQQYYCIQGHQDILGPLKVHLFLKPLKFCPGSGDFAVYKTRKKIYIIHQNG